MNQPTVGISTAAGGVKSKTEWRKLARGHLSAEMDFGRSGGAAIEHMLRYFAVDKASEAEARRLATDELVMLDRRAMLAD